MQRYDYDIPATQLRKGYELGVIRRDRLDALGLTEGLVRAQIRASRWTRWGDHVVLTQNVGPNRQQLMWTAVLDAGPAAVLGSHTALELAGFRSWADQASEIQLIVPRGARSAGLPGVRVHESRRLEPETAQWRAGLPCTDPARSVLDAAAWQPFPRFACAMLASVVQQGLCEPAELDQALARVGRIRHKSYLRLALRDIADGAHAVGELDVARMCRRFGLARPSRQVPRRDSTGRLRYLDVEWRLTNGDFVVLEVDGQHHLTVEHWQDDMKRERGLVVVGRRILRATNLELRLEPGAVARDLLTIGVPRVPVLTQLSA